MDRGLASSALHPDGHDSLRSRGLPPDADVRPTLHESHDLVVTGTLR
jgi:hypothetical protein